MLAHIDRSLAHRSVSHELHSQMSLQTLEQEKLLQSLAPFALRQDTKLWYLYPRECYDRKYVQASLAQNVLSSTWFNIALEFQLRFIQSMPAKTTARCCLNYHNI